MTTEVRGVEVFEIGPFTNGRHFINNIQEQKRGSGTSVIMQVVSAGYFI